MHFLIENQRYKKKLFPSSLSDPMSKYLWNLDDNNYDESCDKLLVFVVTNTEDTAGPSTAAIIHMECAAIPFPYLFGWQRRVKRDSRRSDANVCEYVEHAHGWIQFIWSSARAPVNKAGCSLPCDQKQ